MSAISLSQEKAGIEAGDYVFSVQRWSFRGLRQENELAFGAIKLGATAPMPSQIAESLIVRSAQEGAAVPNALNAIRDIELVHDLARVCNEMLDERFAWKCDEFEAENTTRCNQQETSARKYTDRRVAELGARLVRFAAEGQEKLIPMTGGLIRREQEQLQEKLSRIASLRIIDPTPSNLAAGLIRVE